MANSERPTSSSVGVSQRMVACLTQPFGFIGRCEPTLVESLAAATS
jgi:hypothetical protein